MCLCDVARASRVYELDVPVGEAASHKEQVAVIDERSDVLLCRAVDDPVLPARIGVVTCDALASGEDQLVSAVDLADNRSAVAAGIVGARSFPDCFSGFLIERDDVCGAVVVSVQNYFVLEENRA